MNWVARGSAEKILTTFYEKAVSSVWVHQRVSQQYKREERCIGLPRIVLSSLVGTFSLCLEYIKNAEIKSYALLGVAAIGGINALIGSVQLYLDRGKLSGQHSSASSAWNSFAGKIDICLSKPRSARPECNHFIEQIQSDYARLQESSPDIPSMVVRQFKKECHEWIEADRYVAHQLNGIHVLEVFTGSERSQEDDLAEDDLTAPIHGESLPENLSRFRPRALGAASRQEIELQKPAEQSTRQEI